LLNANGEHKHARKKSSTEIILIVDAFGVFVLTPLLDEVQNLKDEEPDGEDDEKRPDQL
jgi:hypothetical protein